MPIELMSKLKLIPLAAILATAVLAPAQQPQTMATPDPDTMARILALPADLGLGSIDSAPKTLPATRGNTQFVNIYSDGFEAPTLNPAWSVGVVNGFTPAQWGLTNLFAANGNQGVFCAAVGQAAVVPNAAPYPNLMSTGMSLGPFSLADAQSAGMTLNVLYQTEVNFDFVDFLVSADGFNTVGGYSASGSASTDFIPLLIDFGSLPSFDSTISVLGQPQVQIAFRFRSDENTGFFGAVIDDVAIGKNVAVTVTTAPPTTTAPTTTAPTTTAPTTTAPTTTGPTTVPPTTTRPTATPTPTPVGVQTRIFRIFNDGTADLTINSISKQNNSPWVVSIDPAGPFTVPPGKVRIVNVGVNSSLASAGVNRETLVIASNDPDENPFPNGVTIQLTVGGGGTSTPTPTPTPTVGLPTTPSPSVVVPTTAIPEDALRPILNLTAENWKPVSIPNVFTAPNMEVRGDGLLLSTANGNTFGFFETKDTIGPLGAGNYRLRTMIRPDGTVAAGQAYPEIRARVTSENGLVNFLRADASNGGNTAERSLALLFDGPADGRYRVSVDILRFIDNQRGGYLVTGFELLAIPSSGLGIDVVALTPSLANFNTISIPQAFTAPVFEDRSNGLLIGTNGNNTFGFLESKQPIGPLAPGTYRLTANMTPDGTLGNGQLYPEVRLRVTTEDGLVNVIRADASTQSNASPRGVSVIFEATTETSRFRVSVDILRFLESQFGGYVINGFSLTKLE